MGGRASTRTRPARAYFERNGKALGIVFIPLVAFWTLFLVALPYLYMVVESFHPQLPPLKRGGPDDVLTIAQYESFFVHAQRRHHELAHMGALSSSRSSPRWR